MVDGIHIHIRNRTTKPLTVALSGGEKGVSGAGEGEIVGGDRTNVQCKPIQNCHSESPCTMNIY
jgi:hypothetical protein